MALHQKPKLRRLMGVAAVAFIIGLLYMMRAELQANIPLRKSLGAHTLPRVAKVSMLYGKPNSNYEGAIKSHQQHAARWGYPMHVLRQDIAVGFWNKPTYLLATIVDELIKPADKRVQWMMWVDADSIILNPAIPAEIFLPPSDLDDIHVVASQDHNGLNTGIVFVRVHPWTVTMLSETIGYPLHHPEVELGRNADQDVMAGIFKKTDGGPEGKGYADAVVFMPRPLINAYQFSHGFEGEKGSFLVHFPGLEDERWPAMANWIHTLETTPNEWERPAAETDYLNKTDRFWSQVRQARKAIRLVEKNLPSLENVTRERKQDADAVKVALKTLRETLRGKADDLELMRTDIEELHRLTTVMGLPSE
ncbi:Galactosyl transferase [Metarhizium rileyi]|uniref:Galactosyl transferase n=1 Tax=Metarhizium rileyi (strain RCEF 4871) TaxID=1649241 RepID=A0A166RVS5_METRR|nr:Galactosyl transferase [Metarhizium rileyi RCEF 4871]